LRELLNKIKYRLHSFIAKRRLKDYAPKESSIIIAGSARSGTTLLAEMINCSNTQRIIFEPCVRAYVPEWPYKEERVWIDPNADEPELHAFINRLIEGKIFSYWSDSKNIVARPKGRIIKMIRANLILPWLIKNFPDLKIIYIWRDPERVINSRLSFGWGDHLEDLLDFQELVDEFYPNISIRDFLNKGNVYRQCAFWCIENKWPLKALKANGKLIISYDKLLAEPEQIKGQISDYIGAEIDLRCFVKRLNIPSQSTKLNRSKKTFSSIERKEMQEVLAMFEMESYLS